MPRRRKATKPDDSKLRTRRSRGRKSTPVQRYRRQLAARERQRNTVVDAILRKAQRMGFSRESLERDILPRVQITTADAGQILMRPTDKPDWVSINGAGAVKTTIPLGPDRRVVVQYAKPGYVLGVAPVLRRSAPLGFDAVAHTEAVVAGITRDLVRDTLAAMSGAARLQLVAYDVRALCRLILTACQLLDRPVLERIELVLSQLASDFPSPGTPGGIRIPLSHHDLAEYVSAAGNVVCRRVRELERRGCVRRVGSSYIVSGTAVDDGDPGAGGVEADRGYDVTMEESTQRRLTSVVRAIARHLDLGPRATSILIDRPKLRAYSSSDVIAFDGGLHATILLSGSAHVSCQVSRGRKIGVWIAKPGHLIEHDWAGADQLTMPRFRVVAHQDCEVAIYDAEALATLMDACSAEEALQFLGFFHTALSRQLYDRSVMRTLKVPERLLFQLKVCATDFPVTHERGTVIDVPLSRRPHTAPRMLAPYIGASPSKLTVAFGTLLEQKKVEFVDGKILVVGHGLSHRAA
jgi:CRP-like cAMP-binding protein